MRHSPLFLDTGYYRGLLDKDDRYHAVAVRWQRELATRPRELVTTTAVLLELGNHFSHPGPFETALPLLRSILIDRHVTVITITTARLEAGLTFRASRKDKSWGLVDCTSFLVMHKLDIREALACDKHFEQAGFKALLREE